LIKVNESVKAINEIFLLLTNKGLMWQHVWQCYSVFKDFYDMRDEVAICIGGFDVFVEALLSQQGLCLMR